MRSPLPLRSVGVLAVALLYALHPTAAAKGSKGATTPAHVASHATKAGTQARDSHGRIVRSEAAKHQFELQSGYPHGRPGYVVDHIVPLACGGTDAPSNMQWQSIAEGKAKDKVERVNCR